MNSQPCVSVIVPVYNTAPYLVRCVDSILAQTHTNLEIILVNDGSTDESGQICDKYALLDERITVIHKENGGLSSARNAGLDVANGEWIGFVDSDDWVIPEMYERLLVAANSENADITLCGFSYVDERGQILKKNTFKKKAKYTKKEAYNYLASDLAVLYVVAVNKLYKKNIFDNIRYPQGRLHEDEFIIHHLIKESNYIVTIPDTLYMYVQRNGSITNSHYTIQRLLDTWDALYDRYEFFKNQGLRKNAKITMQTLGYIVRKSMERLHYKNHKKTILPLYRKASWLYIISFDFRVIKLFIYRFIWQTGYFIKREVRK
jgi:glycosyltransferase involved in cell wall biosynthesis